MRHSISKTTTNKIKNIVEYILVNRESNPLGIYRYRNYAN